MRRLLKQLFQATISLVVGIIVLMFALGLPQVQNRLVRMCQNILERELETKVHISTVDLTLPAQAILTGVDIYDQRGQIWFHSDHIQINVLTFSLWNFLFQRKQTDILYIDYIKLIRPTVYTYTLPDDQTLNVQFFIDKFTKDPHSNTSTAAERPLILQFPKLRIIGGQFAFHASNQHRADTMKTQHKFLDPRHLDLYVSQGDFSLYLTPDDQLSLRAQKVRIKEEHSQLALNQWNSYFVFGLAPDSAYLNIPKFTLNAPNVNLNVSGKLSGKTLPDIFAGNFNKPFQLNIEDVSVNATTINKFLPTPINTKGIFNINGEWTGTKDWIKSPKFQFEYEDSTKIFAAIHIKNFSNPKLRQSSLQVFDSFINVTDLPDIFPQLSFPEALLRVPFFSLSGVFQEFEQTFSGNTDITSKVGDIFSNFSFSTSSKVPEVRYKAQIHTKNLRLNYLLGPGSRFSDSLNFKGTLNGSGFTLDELDSDLIGLFTNSDYRGYMIDSASIDVHVRNKQIIGELMVNDQEGMADVEIDWNMKEDTAEYKIAGFIQNIDLNHYQFSDKPINLTAQIKVDISGDSLDKLNGEAQFFNTQLIRPDTNLNLFLPDIYLSSDQNSTNYKLLKLRSDLGDADLSGNFTFQKAYSLFQRLLYEGQLYFSNNDSLIEEYYSTKIIDTTNLEVNVKLIPRDSANRLLDFLKIPLHITPHDSLIGKMYFSRTEYAELNVEMDSLEFMGQSFKQTNLSISVAKYADQPELNIASGLEIDTLISGNILILEDVTVDLDGSESQIESDVFFQQKNAGNRFQLKVNTTFFQDKVISTIDSLPSMLILKEDTLRVSEWNVGTYQDQAFQIEDFTISGINRSVSIGGEISKSSESELRVDIGEWNIGLLSKVLEVSYNPTGTIIGSLSIEHPLVAPKVLYKGKIENFAVDDFTYGEIITELNWDDISQKIQLDTKLLDENRETLRLVGNYQLDSSASPLDFNLVTQNPFPLNYINPFVKGQLYGIEGQVALETFQITGDWDNLEVTGTGHFEEALVGIDFFRSEYRFNGDIKFDRNVINFPRITLYDPNARTADFYGDIYHQGLKDFVFDLQLEEMNNFQIMNTKATDQEAFYGKIILANGIAAITGNLTQLEVEAYIMTGPQTNLKIPVSDYETVEKPGYIQFISTDEENNIKNNSALEGFDLNITIAATEDALVELIFDERAGDIIRGRGNGNLNILINEEGSLSLFGSYEINEGAYLFTSQNVINKRFTVKPGGTINWSGDPYQASLNIEAIYSLSATLPVAESNANSSGSTFSPRVPVNVLMAMKGSLEQPEISLSIELPSVTEQEVGSVASYLKAVQYDEQELNKQVFSLLVFNRFAPAGGLLDNQAGGSGVTTSISELISNQVNYWLSQAINENLNVNVSTQNFQDVSLLISAKLFNERVIVERNGIILGPQTENSDFPLGNLSLIIKLLPNPNKPTSLRRSGELVLEVFSRANFAEINRQIQSANQTGLGLFFKKDFDDLKDLLKRRSKN